MHAGSTESADVNVSLWHSPISNFGKPAPLAEEALRAVCGARANAKASPIQAKAIMETAGGPIRGLRVPWFTTMAPPLSLNDTVGRRFIQAAKVSVLSARRNAPSLSPYLLYCMVKVAYTHGNLFIMYFVSIFVD